MSFCDRYLSIGGRTDSEKLHREHLALLSRFVKIERHEVSSDYQYYFNAHDLTVEQHVVAKLVRVTKRKTTFRSYCHRRITSFSFVVVAALRRKIQS
jgi:hypothetical protein